MEEPKLANVLRLGVTSGNHLWQSENVVISVCMRSCSADGQSPCGYQCSGVRAQLGEKLERLLCDLPLPTILQTNCQNFSKRLSPGRRKVTVFVQHPVARRTTMSVFDSIKHTFFHLLMVIYLFYNPTDSGAVQIKSDNVDMTLASNELVFLNFYAEWCRFSNLLQPIFDEAAEKVQKEFPDGGKVVMGKVDCDKETTVASRFHITKYPTLKIIRNGQPTKREYRGQRSVDAFVEFIRKQLADPIKEFHSIKDLENLDSKKRIIIGYFDRRDLPEYNNFRRVATNLKEDCQFHVGFGDAVAQMHPPGNPIIVFRPDVALSHENDETFTGSLQSYDELNIWVQEKCVPLVREITFENAEELTEEGLPFLILFHASDDTESIKDYKSIVEKDLISEKQNINFLTADGKRFAHPLHHLGKSQSDLPLLAIDSFRHMYLFPTFKDMYTPGKLKEFLNDLYNGKLHREFHYGSESVVSDIIAVPAHDGRKNTSPPDSTFKKLLPSKDRYTLLRDEL